MVWFMVRGSVKLPLQKQRWQISKGGRSFSEGYGYGQGMTMGYLSQVVVQKETMRPFTMALELGVLQQWQGEFNGRSSHGVS